MNWHFTFFLFDVVVWVGIALISTHVFIAKSHKSTISIATTLSTILITLCAGLLSVLNRGLPDVGFSTNSFIYATLVSFSFVLYQQIKRKKVLIKILHMGKHAKNISFPNIYKEVGV